MTQELIPISVHKIMQSHSYTVIILGDEKKQFSIYTEPHVGRYIQNFLTKQESPRPMTFDLFSNLFEGMEISLLQVVINHVKDAVYYSRLFVEQIKKEEKQIIEIDARPSDAITLALLKNAPLFCNKEVYESAETAQD